MRQIQTKIKATPYTYISDSSRQNPHATTIMEKRPADSEANGAAENGAKKVKLDPECGRLLFCGSTNWHLVGCIKKKILLVFRREATSIDYCARPYCVT